MSRGDPIHDVPELRSRNGVFEDRADAGRQLAPLLLGKLEPDAVVLAIPAGGVPVAAEVAKALGLPLDVAVVNKITLPWNTEVGCGAVAFDGTVQIDRAYVDRIGLQGEALAQAVDRAREKVSRRLALFRSGRDRLSVDGRTAVLIDDGVASGATLKLAAEAVRRAGAAQLIIAVPTGHPAALEALAERAEAVYCANVRQGYGFAVADAYRHWYDEDEQQVARKYFAARP